MERLKVLHIDTEKTWRGGENQMRLLMEGSQDLVQNYLATPADGEAAKRLSTIAEVIPIETRGLGLLRSALSLSKSCRDLGIELLDCQTSKAHGLGLLVKKLNPDLKLVVHRRVDFPLKNSWINQKKYRSKLVDRYIPISGAIAKILTDYGLPKEQVSPVHSAVDPSPFKTWKKEDARQDLASSIGFDLEKPLIVNVAYHTEQKGMPTLIRGLAKLKSLGKEFTCLLAGEGHLTPSLKSLCDELNLNQEIRFLGIRNDVPKLLAGADIFALPSNYEGLGTSILDALHSSCAVAASNIGGIPEMIIHGETGLLSDVGDSETLGINLNTFIENPDLATRCIKAGQAHAEKNFSIESMVNGNLDIYKNLCQ